MVSLSLYHVPIYWDCLDYAWIIHHCLPWCCAMPRLPFHMLSILSMLPYIYIFCHAAIMWWTVCLCHPVSTISFMPPVHACSFLCAVPHYNCLHACQTSTDLLTQCDSFHIAFPSPSLHSILPPSGFSPLHVCMCLPTYLLPSATISGCMFTCLCHTSSATVTMGPLYLSHHSATMNSYYHVQAYDLTLCGCTLPSSLYVHLPWTMHLGACITIQPCHTFPASALYGTCHATSPHVRLDSSPVCLLYTLLPHTSAQVSHLYATQVPIHFISYILCVVLYHALPLGLLGVPCHYVPFSCHSCCHS